MRLAARIEPAAKRVGEERGTAVIEGLLAFGLVLLVLALAVQAAVYVHARSVAQTAAQEGARSAAVSGPGAGTARASTVLRSAGGTGGQLHATASAGAASVTVSVSGSAPRVFPVSLPMPGIAASASLPLERFPTQERRG
jgi:Flp pilus assembly protein TadG